MTCFRRTAVFAMLFGACAACVAQVQFGGNVLVQGVRQQVADGGPLAQANALQNGIVPKPGSGASAEVELRGNGHGITGIATLAQQRPEEPTTDRRGWVNELYGSLDRGAWQFSAGKRIVAWDVGQGFRPNDMIQQEDRRALVTRTLEGHPLLMTEYFSARAALSAVWVNPGKSESERGVAEPALAVRLYRRDDDVDWYGFGRVGVRTGPSLGFANAWIASDAVELHSSIRVSKRIDSIAIDPSADGLARSNPWLPYTRTDVKQVLAGGTWTGENQVSLLAEAWYDGAALSDAEWDAWARRNQAVAALAAMGAPLTAVAGNLAWQANAFGASPNLRRENVLLRLSWKSGDWEPAVDMLYTPADSGRAITASLNWQGNRVRLQGRLRAYGGPDSAVMAQLPSRRIAYVGVTWPF